MCISCYAYVMLRVMQTWEDRIGVPHPPSGTFDEHLSCRMCPFSFLSLSPFSRGFFLSCFFSLSFFLIPSMSVPVHTNTTQHHHHPPNQPSAIIQRLAAANEQSWIKLGMSC